MAQPTGNLYTIQQLVDTLKFLTALTLKNMCSYEKHIKMKTSLINSKIFNWEAQKETDSRKNQESSQIFVTFLKPAPLFWAFVFFNGDQAHVQSGFTGTFPYIQ